MSTKVSRRDRDGGEIGADTVIAGSSSSRIENKIMMVNFSTQGKVIGLHNGFW